MGNTEKILERMRESPQNLRFTEVATVCDQYFEVRQKGTSHRVYKMPWEGDPRINLQKDKNGKAKAYQVKQAVKTIDLLLEEP